MTAGVPGSGIGGFFYLLSALLMPVKESISFCQKKSNRASRRVVLRQILNASGVLCGVWLTGWFISRGFCMVSASMHAQGDRLVPVLPVLRWNNLAYGLLTLLAVFLFVQVLGASLRLVRPHTKRFPKA